MPYFSINKKSPLEQFKKAVAKGDSAKAKKAMKSDSFNELASYPCAAWDIKWTFCRDNIWAIHYICCKGDRETLNMMLDKHDDELHRKTASGVTTLHFAVYYSKYDILEELLSRGVEVDSKESSKGFTALHLAVEKRNMGAIKRLVDDGLADINIKDDSGESPKERAERMKSKTILKYFASLESKLKFERDMHQMAAEQVRQKEEQEKLQQRNLHLENRLSDMTEAISREVSNQLEQRLNGMTTTDSEFESQRPSVSGSRPPPPPPIPPRRRADSAASSVPSFLAVPTSSPSTLTPSRGASQTVKDKIDWWTNKSTSKTSLVAHDDANDRARSRNASGNPTQQPAVASVSMNDSRQRLLSSPFGSHVDLNMHLAVNDSDRTSGFGSHGILEEEDVLSPLARYQITSNFPDLIYYLRYDRLEASLFSKSVLHALDFDKLKSLHTNHEQMTYVLKDIILKGDNRILRLFLEALEENGYAVHAKKIRNTSALGLYSDRQDQTFNQASDISRVRPKSTPIIYRPGEFKMAVEATDREAGDEC